VNRSVSYNRIHQSLSSFVAFTPKDKKPNMCCTAFIRFGSDGKTFVVAFNPVCITFCS